MAHDPIRYVGLHHISFFRAAFETDLALQDIADRYLETGQDLPAAKRTLKMVQSALIQAAKRYGKHGQAALLRVPRQRFRELAPIDSDAPKIPSLDDYRHEVDPDGFYRDSELLEMYRDEYGSLVPAQPTAAQERRQVRNLRLLQRKIQIINQLAVDVARPPTLDDWIDGWFDRRVADRLLAGGMKTLGDLILFMNHRGFRWYRVVPQLGAVTAKRIVSFLLGSSLGEMLSTYALMPIEQYRRTQRTKPQHTKPAEDVELVSVSGEGPISRVADAVVPMERFAGPQHELSGIVGSNRAESERNRLQADDDLGAIRAWLALKNGHTLLAYRKEAERLLLWAVLAKRKAFSSLTIEDAGEFLRFLENPTPRDVWVSDRRYERFHPAWRPFIKKGLSRNGVAYSMMVLSSMCSWLVRQRYLDSNPFDGLPSIRSNKANPVSRSISISQWELIKDYLDSLDASAPSVRKRFLGKLAYATGLRVHELAKARVGDLTLHHFPNGSRSWFLKVQGKGEKVREVPFVQGLRRELDEYLASRGVQVEDLGAVDPELPLLARGNDSLTPLGVRRILDLMKEICGATADRVESVDPDSARVLRSMTTHWLRHSNATHALFKGVPLASVRDNLGHASLSTTSTYIHTAMSERHQEAEGFLAGI